jgi:hypothetical protein
LGLVHGQIHLSEHGARFNAGFGLAVKSDEFIEIAYRELAITAEYRLADAVQFGRRVFLQVGAIVPVKNEGNEQYNCDRTDDEDSAAVFPCPYTALED